MPYCATYNESGQVLVVTPPPADMSTCALLLPTVADNANNPFYLSAADGTTIAFAVVAAWMVGMAGRLLIRSLSTGENSNEQDS